MFVGPVVTRAATLNLGNVLILAGIAFASVSLIAIAPSAAMAGGRGLAAATLPGRHLDGAGDRHRLHLGLCLAHRLESARMSAGAFATQLALARTPPGALGALATGGA
jgi:hypothetical protein